MLYPDPDTMKTLAALALDIELALFDGEVLAAKIAPDKWYKISDAELAELVGRGWVEVSEHDDAEGLPRDARATESGRYWLERYRNKHKIDFVPGGTS